MIASPCVCRVAGGPDADRRLRRLQQIVRQRLRHKTHAKGSHKSMPRGGSHTAARTLDCRLACSPAVRAFCVDSDAAKLKKILEDALSQQAIIAAAFLEETIGRTATHRCSNPVVSFFAAARLVSFLQARL